MIRDDVLMQTITTSLVERSESIGEVGLIGRGV